MKELATLRDRLIVATTVASVGCAHAANPGSVVVKGQGSVDLAPFECTDKTRSGFITRVCYDARNRRLVLGFQDGTYRQFCKVNASTTNGLLSAPYLGRFYSTNIRGVESKNPHECPMIGLKKGKRKAS